MTDCGFVLSMSRLVANCHISALPPVAMVTVVLHDMISVCWNLSFLKCGHRPVAMTCLLSIECTWRLRLWQSPINWVPCSTALPLSLVSCWIERSSQMVQIMLFLSLNLCCRESTQMTSSSLWCVLALLITSFSLWLLMCCLTVSVHFHIDLYQSHPTCWLF